MGLTLSRLPSDTYVFVDSNIFLYVFFKHSVYGDSCREFLKRIENGEVLGFIDEFVQNEVFHKLMVAAVASRKRLSLPDAVSYIKRNPDILKTVPELWQACELLKSMDLEVIPGPLFGESLVLSEEFQLLATDAIHVAAMQKAGIENIASNDSDYLRVKSFRVWRPMH